MEKNNNFKMEKIIIFFEFLFIYLFFVNVEIDLKIM
jgi:hypothetical protein